MSNAFPKHNLETAPEKSKPLLRQLRLPMIAPTAWLLIYKLEVLLAQNAFHLACVPDPFTLMVVGSIMAHPLGAINNQAMAAKADSWDWKTILKQKHYMELSKWTLVRYTI